MEKIFTKRLTGFLFFVLLFFTTARQLIAQPAQFNANIYSGCAPLTVSFYNSSSGNGTYTWYFGDPSSGSFDTSYVCSPSHTFANAGTYTVTLNYQVGPNTYTATSTITVHPKPNPVISGQDTLCDGETINYTVTGSPGSTYFWTVNGGTFSGPNAGTSVNVTWPTPGTGLLTVTETNTFGCSKSTRIHVLVASQPRIGSICDHRGSAGQQPDKEKRSCLCAFNTNVIQAIDINNQLFNNSLYNFQWTVTGSGYLAGGQGTNTATIYAGAGPTVTVQLVVWNDFGCTDTQTCIYDICPSPHAHFVADTACEGGATHFNASGSAPQSDIVSYYWDFGDFQTATTTSPFISHTYASSGVYSVYLRVKNKDGCTADTTIDVLVNEGTPPPITCPGTVCHGTKHCYSTPYYPGATYTWTVTGHTSYVLSANDTGICITWGDGPLGNITLEVTGGPYSCGYNSIDIPIFPKDLEISGPDTICSGSQAVYTVPLIPGSCYSWLPSSPNINVSNNPGNQVTISVPPNVTGTFNLIADVINDITCCSGKDTFTITIQGPIEIDTIQPVCEFSTASYTSNVPVTWTVIGGAIASSTPTTLTVNWGSAGNGVIHATALNPNLVCENSVSATVQLVPLPPNPPINGPMMVCVGSTVNYNYINSPQIAGSTWTISPGATHSPSGNTDVVTFTTPGSYTITVNYFNTNYNNSGGQFNCYSSSQIQVLVVDTTCPNISGPAPACIGQTATYNMSSNPGGIWSWSVVGGAVVSQTATSITITWGNISEGQVNVQNTLCNGFCGIKVKINAYASGAITLGDSTCAGTSIPLCAPPGYTYTWNTSATTQCITATSAGTYTVTLGGTGYCPTVLTYNLNPIPKRPKPNVFINWSCMLAPSTPVPYQMVATYNPNWSYAWSPQTTTPAAADTTNTHYSTVSGSTHTVIVTNQFGCKDTASVTVSGSCVDTIVCPNPPCTGCSCKATATVNYDPCNGIFSFTQTSGSPISAVFWNFGDGVYSNQSSPQHWFTAVGNYSGVLSVWCGCNWITIPYTINVPYILRPKITHSFPTACNYNTINLNYTSTNSTVLGGGLTHQINWGDGPTVTVGGLPQSHTYSSPGTYYVAYTVTALAPYCQKTVYDTVTIIPFEANFGFCDSGCVSQPVQFYDNSTSAIPIVQWNWNFGDGNTSNLQSPFHVYGSTGTYTVTLSILNQQGCTDVVSYNINITTFNAGTLSFTKNGVPAFGNTFSICEGGYVTASAPLVSGWTYSWNDGEYQSIDTITSSGIYYCVIANGDGCTDTLGPFTVIVNPNPNATILMPDSACNNGLLVCQALNGLGYNYNWNLNNGAYVDSANPAWFFVPGGSYNVVLTVTNAFGCKAYDTFIHTSLSPPVVTVTPGYTAICEGATVTLTANVAGPYTSLVWYTGDTTTSIVAYTNGSHSVTVTDANGCSSTASGYVQVNPLPDLSNIPKGCYKVCNTHAGFKVCGPIPIAALGQSFTYNWLYNNAPWQTTQNVSIFNAGTYQLIVTNISTGCSDTSETFNVQFVPGPSSGIGSGSPNPTICAGSNACVTIWVENAEDDVVYSWFYNEEPDPVGEGDSIVICDPGIYILESFRSNCCKKYDTIVIKEGDCCFDVLDPDFHLIQDSTVYTTNQWWDGKYYVAGRVFVRNKAILDMTTIDVVFDRDGEIIFEDSSIVRANNSVFRPCDMHDVWVGFTFKDSSSGFIHTSLFKNANHAIDVNTVGPEAVKITDNTFTDCNIGIRLDRGTRTYNQGITRNSFVIDDYDYTTPGLHPSFDYFGIVLRSTRMSEIISQNEFRNSDRSGQNNRFYGIYKLRSEAVISENKFTNMYRSIDVVSNSGLTTIENNEIEKTWQGKFGSDVQIRITNCVLPVLVFGNELRNSDNKYTNTVGIFAEQTHGLNIRDNNIKGFDVGIWTRRTSSGVINENDIDLAGDVGILDSLSTKLDINCNIVRLKDCSGGFLTTCKGVGILMQQGNSGNRIFTNCVFDTRRAIMVQHSLPAVTIPFIINNYLYNYQFAGVTSIGHTGNIGGAGQPGRNTFVSNNTAGGAWDIQASGGAISQQCNFGILATSGTVSSTGCPGTSMNSSTAACGQQINNVKNNKLDKWDVCDAYTGKSIIIIIHDGEVEIDKDKLGVALLPQVPLEERKLVSELLIRNNDKASFDLWMKRMENEKGLDQFSIALLQAKWLYSNQSAQAGYAALSGIVTSDPDEGSQLAVLKAIWKSEMKQFANTDLYEMNGIDQQNHTTSPVARDVIQSYRGGHDYRFGTYHVLPEGDKRNPENSFLILKPNPAKGEVFIEFGIAGASELNIDFYDITGQKVVKSALLVSEATYKCKLDGMSPGIYFVSVTDPESKIRQVSKLIIE